MKHTTFNELKKKFQAIAGLSSLTNTDLFFLKNSLNQRLNDAWSRMNWPELIEVKTISIAPDSTGTHVGSTGDEDILQVYNKNPHADRTARVINYQLIDSKIYLNVNEIIYNAEVFALIKKAFVEYDENSMNIPKIFESYLTSAMLSDFYRGDGQGDLASREEGRAEEFLIRQIDRIERLQQQNPLMVTQYNNTATNSIFYS